MTRPPLTVTEDTAPADIADLMETNSIKRLPVMRGRDAGRHRVAR